MKTRKILIKAIRFTGGFLFALVCGFALVVLLAAAGFQ